MAENLFSFELRSRKDNGQPSSETLGEYFLLNGPVRYSEQYKFRVRTMPTFGHRGSSTVDYGPDNNILSLEGEFHIHFLARPPQGSEGGSFLDRFDDGEEGLGFGDVTEGAKSIYDDAKGLVTDYSGTAKRLYDRSVGYMERVIPVPGMGGLRSGEMEFFDFLAIMSGVWDEKILYEPEDKQAAAILTKFKEKKDPFSYSNFALMFHDYARRRHVEVVVQPDGFKISRSTQDTNTYKWEIGLVVIQDEKDTAFELPNKLERYFNANFEAGIGGVMQDLKDIVNFPTELSGRFLRMSGAFKNLSRIGTELQNSWDTMRGVFSSDGRLASNNFTEAFANVGRGFREEPEEQNAIQKANSARAEFQRRLREMAQEIQAAMDELGLITVSPNQPLESYAATPESNFESLIEIPYYEQLLEAQTAVIDLEAYIKKAATDNQYIIHKAIGGDTWESLAEKYMQDPDLGSALAAYNRKRRGQGIVSESIKIPYEHNLQVWASQPASPTNADIERGVLGEDLALTDQRDFAVAANGDLDVVEGEPALMNNVIDQIDTPEGGLPMYPDFGNPAKIGEVQENFFKDRYIDRLLAKIEADPRIRSTRITGIRQDGNSLVYLVGVTSINGNRTFFLEVF